jgi:hypothetical protein
MGMARDPVEVNFNPATREYCHVLRFPLGWPMPIFFVDQRGHRNNSPLPFSLSNDYEFRVPGLLGTKFLVRGVQDIVDKYYTANVYEADFSAPKGIARPASEEEWKSAAPIALWRGGKAYDFTLPSRLSKYVEFGGHQFPRNGDQWGGTVISPDRGVLVMESWSGKLGPGGSDVPLDFSAIFKFGGNHGKLFVEFYDADTARKMVTITANFTLILPEDAFGKTGWVTERYFMIPLDDRRERCLVCEFGHARE